jgi:hypothetical protein
MAVIPQARYCRINLVAHTSPTNTHNQRLFNLLNPHSHKTRVGLRESGVSLGWMPGSLKKTALLSSSGNTRLVPVTVSASFMMVSMVQHITTFTDSDVADE